MNPFNALFPDLMQYGHNLCLVFVGVVVLGLCTLVWRALQTVRNS